MSGKTAQLPAQVLDLENWYLTLPIPGDGAKRKEARIVKPDELRRFTHATHFYVPAGGTYVVLDTFAGGAVTPNSKNTRCELRETRGKELASWSTSVGSHALKFSGSVTVTPRESPSIVIGQIHDDEDDVIEIRCWKPRDKDAFIIDVFHDKTTYGVLDAGYAIGTVYDIKVTATSGVVCVYYGDERAPKVKIPCKKSGCYFKVGCYLQNCAKINAAERAAVRLYRVAVTHATTRMHEVAEVAEVSLC